MMKNPTASQLSSLDGFFGKRGFWVLGLFALLYYGYYYRAGLYPAAEGGVEGMVALRLLEGQRPIVDTFLGYNLLWFYPVVGIFKLIGPNYTALRIFFYILSTLTGLISFRLVRKCTDSAGLAFLAALLVILIPGQMFRNYMAFIVVLNMTTFLSAYVLPAHSTAVRLLWMTATGITLAIAWLIRVDVGFFLTCLAAGLIVIYPLGALRSSNGDRAKIFFGRAGVAATGLLLSLLCFLLVHLPFYLDASRRGFSQQFAAQYEQWPAMINYQGKRLMDSASRSLAGMLKHPQKSPPPSVPQGLGSPPAFSSPAPASPAPENAASGPSSPPERNASQAQETKKSQQTLARSSFTAVSARDRMLAFNLYLPILAAGLLGTGALLGWVTGLFLRSGEVAERCLMLLTALGSSLSLFPQYFFWRPDMVHLSEFMVPMTLTLLLGCFVALGVWGWAGSILRCLLGVFLVSATVTLVLYYINACQSQSSGGIAVSLNKHLDFHAANGVHVKLTPSEYADARTIYKIITSASVPGEYVICYPYNPEINFMTDRPSYEYNFYVDNAMVPPDRFYRETVGKILSYRPVVFVITNWEINNTEASEFKNWAAQTYGYIARNYRLAYRHGNVDVFVRPDRVGLIPKD